MVTNICVGNYVGDIYHHATFYLNRLRSFGSAHAWFRAPRHKVTRLFWGGDSWERLQRRRVHRFWRKIRQSTQFRARKCLLGVSKPKSKVSTPSSPKPPFLGPISAALAWCLEHPAVMSEYTTVVHGVLATYYVVTGITAVLKTYNKSIPQWVGEKSLREQRYGMEISGNR